MNHSLEFGSSQNITCFVKKILTRWWTMPRASGFVFLLRIPESTMSHICFLLICWFLSVGCMHFRTCNIRYQLPNIRRNLGIASSKKSRRTRRSRCYSFQISNSLILHWLGWSPRISRSHWALNKSSNLFFSICVNWFNIGMWDADDYCHGSPCAGGKSFSFRLLPQVLLWWNSSSRTLDSLDSETSTSFWTCCKFGTSVTRGNLVWLMHLAVEFLTRFHANHIAGSVSERLIACDRVWWNRNPFLWAVFK